MKEKDAKVDFDKHQLVLYVEREDGSYGPLQTGSYISANFLDDYWGKMNKLRTDLMNQLKSGKISSIYYYRMLHDFTHAELARRVGLTKRKVKKHENPIKFRAIKLKTLAKYAKVFDIPVANLFQIIVLGGEKDSITNDTKDYNIEQNATENHFVTITKIDKK